MRKRLSCGSPPRSNELCSLIWISNNKPSVIMTIPFLQYSLSGSVWLLCCCNSLAEESQTVNQFQPGRKRQRISTRLLYYEEESNLILFYCFISFTLAPKPISTREKKTVYQCRITILWRQVQLDLISFTLAPKPQPLCIFYRFTSTLGHLQS